MIVDNNDFKSEVEDSKGFVFVDFYADLWYHSPTK